MPVTVFSLLNRSPQRFILVIELSEKLAAFKISEMQTPPSTCSIMLVQGPNLILFYRNLSRHKFVLTLKSSILGP